MTLRGRGPRRLAALAALGAVEVAALAAMAWWPPARATPVPALVVWGVAWCAMAAGWTLVRRPARRAGPLPANGGSLLDDGRARALVWGVGVAGRAALLPATPHFSDDIYRFLWDGWVGLNGVNPYLHPPDAAALEPLRTAWHHLVNHPSVSTVYPPAAQIAFQILAAVGPSVLLFKAAWVAADLGVGWLLDRLDRRRPGPRSALLLWLWSPLVLVEVAWSGHLEPLGLLPMVAALLWLDGRPAAAGRAIRAGPARDDRPAGASPAPGDGPPPGGGLEPAAGGALLGLGAAVKFAPAAALPALWRRHGWRAAAVAVAVPLLLSLPYLGAGRALVSGLGEYAGRWEFNAGLFSALRAVTGGEAARLVGVAVPAVLAVDAARRGWTVERALFWCIGAALVLSPTVHPWYLLWVLPLAALRKRPAWILWTGLIFLAYAGLDVYRATGQWPQPPALRALVHVPFLVLLAGGAVRRAARPDSTDSGGRGVPDPAASGSGSVEPRPGPADRGRGQDGG